MTKDDAMKDLLTKAACVGEWYVSEDNIVAAGTLVECGLATARMDYDGLWIVPTERGRALIGEVA